MMTKPFYRSLQAGLLLLTILVIGWAYYLQYVGGFQPCPLCLTQRFFVFILVVIGMVGVCQQSLERVKIISGSQILAALIGLIFAVRQLWLQHLPVGQAPACIPDFGVLIRYFPWMDVMHALFWGAGDCAEVAWKWLGLSMAGWSALYFLMMLIVSGFVFFRLRQPLMRGKK